MEEGKRFFSIQRCRHLVLAQLLISVWISNITHSRVPVLTEENLKGVIGIEVWKRYLTSPLPSVELVMFSIESSRPNSEATLRYGSWQENGFFLRVITNATDENLAILLPDLTSAHGRLRTNYWYASANRVVRRTTDYIPPELFFARLTSTPDPVRRPCVAMERTLLTALTFDLPGLDLNSIRWSETEMNFNLGVKPCSAKWKLNKNSMVNELMVNINGKAGALKLQYEYETDGTLPAFIPSLMTRWIKSDDDYKLASRTRIAKFKLAEAQLPDTRFLPSFLMETNAFRISELVHTNNEMYQVKRGRLVSLNSLNQNHQAAAEGLKQRPLVLTVLWAFFILSSVVIFFCVKKQSEKKE